MSLFGAATSGIDPQSGAYLSKEQRVAMFRASRGMRGGGAGGANSGGARATVEPKAAIVVANKFSEITRTLNTNFQRSATNISDQARSNKQSIENLYNIISNKRTQELKTEKEETRQTALRVEKNKRATRENFVEGISKAAAAAIAPLQKVAKKTSSILGGFWDRLKKALLLLGAAWLIDNLPQILQNIESFSFDVESCKEALIATLPNIRGVFGVFDKIFRAGVRGVRRIAGAAFRLARNIASSAFRVARKVFNAIKRVTSKVVGAIVNGIKKVVGGLARSLNSARRAIAEVAGKAGTALNGAPAKAGEPAKKGLFGNILSKMKEGGSKIKSFAGRVGGRLGMDKMREGAGNFMRGFKDLAGKAAEKLNPLQSYATSQGIAKGSGTSRLTGITSLLEKVFSAAGIAGKAGKKLLSGIAKIARPLLRLPGIGIAVDIALNKAGGQGNEEALIRGLASGISGMVGMKAGATVGAAIGTVAIPIPVIGTGVGGILGGLIGSILAANTADALAKAGLQMAGRDTTSDRTMSANYGSIVENITNNNNSATVSPAVDKTHPEKSIKIAPGDRVGADGTSTPDGMQLSSGQFESSFNFEELPPIMSTMPGSKKEATVLPQQDVPNISTRDPQSDIYRQMAGELYELSGAF